MDSSKISFKNVIKAWWKFFWRYIILLYILLIANGFLLNYLYKLSLSTSLLYKILIRGNLLLNLCAAICVFFMILGKKSKRSSFVLVPSSRKKSHSDSNECKINWQRTVLTSLDYFWRYAIFALALGFFLALLYEKIGLTLGIDSFTLQRYATYTGNIAALPASLAVFILLMWRSKKYRKLEFIPVAE